MATDINLILNRKSIRSIKSKYQDRIVSKDYYSQELKNKLFTSGSDVKVYIKSDLSQSRAVQWSALDKDWIVPLADSYSIRLSDLDPEVEPRFIGLEGGDKNLVTFRWTEATGIEFIRNSINGNAVVEI